MTKYAQDANGDVGILSEFYGTCVFIFFERTRPDGTKLIGEECRLTSEVRILDHNPTVAQ